MLHSFGGRAHTIPHVDIKCIVQNAPRNVINFFNYYSKLSSLAIAPFEVASVSLVTKESIWS